jgi:integrase
MPNQAKGPRLYLKGKGDTARWIIRDGERRIATGCRAGVREEAELKLAAYIDSKHTPERKVRRSELIDLTDVLKIYAADVVSKLSGAPLKRASGRLMRLIRFFGGKMLSQMSGDLCRAYRDSRGTEGGARRDLQDLSAAIQHHHREGFHTEDIRVWLPPPGERRERWLTRAEIARLVWAAWSFRSAMPIPGQYQTGAPPPGIRRPSKHIARAVLFAYYTGSRPGDALRASFLKGPGRSFVDLEHGVFYRKPPGKRETNKRQPPCRLGTRILGHLRRWRDRKVCASFAVEYDGGPVLSIKTGLHAAIARAGLEGAISTYTLRHSRITHLMQKGIDAWEVAGNVGTSEKMIRDHYGHHDPRAQSRAANG